MDRLRGSPVALVEQDGFLATYLQKALERHGAIVTSIGGEVAEMIALLLHARPRPVVAALDARLSADPAINAALRRLDLPFLLVAQHRSPPADAERPSAPLWQWPFGAFQVVEALNELIATHGGSRAH
jgi:hypothetical protein